MATSMMQSKGEGGGTYTYSSQPRAVPQGKKYRDQSYGNIMYDRRIVRGNTYALHTLPASSQPDPLELQRQQESRRRAIARKRAREQFRPHSPEAVEGRKHMEVQTELYLEEITDRVEEAEVQTQTDAFLDRPPTPLFVPAKTGVDVATQIEDGDLFDFDLEVRPILEVLVGKTVEQALLEVMEEEELANLRAQQRQFEENRNAEMVETQRLEEQERRRREEKDRRMQQQREALLKEKETAEKIAARAFAQSYLGDLVPSVFSTLHESGFFYDPVEREVETVFMPWLLDEAEKALDKKILARTILDSIIREVVMRQLGIPIPEPVVPSDPPSTEAQPTPQQGTTQPSVSEVKTEPDSEADKQKLSQEEPSETVQQEKPSETVQQEKPSETVQQEKPSETVQQEEPSETVQQEKPSETVQQEEPSETVQQEEPSETVQQEKQVASEEEGKKAEGESKVEDEKEGKKDGDVVVEGGTEGGDSVTLQPGTEPQESETKPEEEKAVEKTQEEGSEESREEEGVKESKPAESQETEEKGEDKAATEGDEQAS